jgi:hypothetical protein
MKKKFHKIIIAFIGIFLINSFVNAQCTPDTLLVNTGVYPAILPAARVGQTYAEILQFHVTKDTMVTIPIFGTTKANIDSFTIVNVNGIPNGMSFQCNTLNCAIPGGGNGCADIKGTPTQKGVYPLEIVLKIKVSIGIFGSQTVYDTLTAYSLIVNSPVSIKNSYQNENFNYQIFPNPIVNNQFNLSVWNKKSTHCTVKIYNMQGVLVALQLVNLNAGFNQQNIQLDGIAKGIYLFQIENENNQFHEKVVVE